MVPHSVGPRFPGPLLIRTLLLTCMIHEGKDHAYYIYSCVSSNMLGAGLVVSKYLLSEQMNNLILVPLLGHS